MELESPYADPILHSTTSNSARDSTSSSFSFYQSSPPPSTNPANVKLSLTNLSYTIHPNTNLTTSFLNPSKKPKPVTVLKSVSLVANSSEILAVVGPSGAGKSTLLRVISGRVHKSDFDPNSISLNDRPVSTPSHLRKICGFVTQEDNLLPLLTVKETLMFSAKFRLTGMSSKQREERVDSLLLELGLDHVAQSYIGDEETRGISGGERKRVSIGVDVIHDPPILLLDEPTSGLDSKSALQVIELLSSMALARQQTLILTIHQPSYRILGYVSNFLLLSRGTPAFCGSLGLLEDTISQMGYIIPSQINTIEFALEITRQIEEYWNAKHDHVLVGHEEQTITQSVIWSLNQPTLQDVGVVDVDNGNKCSRWDETKSLSWRFWKIMYRTKQLFLARTMQATVGGFALGSVYLNVKMNQDGVTKRLGLFAFSLSFLLSSTVEALPIFLQERRVLMRESSRRMYRLSSYMVANTLVSIPFLMVVALLFSVPVYWLVGLNPTLSAFMFFVFIVWMIVMMASSLVLFLSAISPDFILGNSLICISLGIFFLFSGYFIPKESIPKYWIFMYYVSLYRYPLDSLVINEYWSMRDKCFSWQGGEHPRCLLTGGDVLKGRELDEDTRWMNVGIMCGFFLIYRILGWIVLVRKASKTML